jgi:hypothetical protein
MRSKLPWSAFFRYNACVGGEKLSLAYQGAIAPFDREENGNILVTLDWLLSDFEREFVWRV